MAKDPYKYFRIEAREILEGLSQGALELEKGVEHKEVVTRLFRYAHTLKGAARVVKQPALADGAHAIEEVLSPHRASGAPVPRGSIDELLRLVDKMSAAVEALGSGAEAVVGPVAAAPQPPTTPNDAPSTRTAAAVPAAPAAPAADERLETVRVDIQEMDALLDDIFQASAQITALAGGEAALAQARQEAATLLDQVTGRRASRNATASLERARVIVEQLTTTLSQLQGRLTQGRDQAEGAIRLVRERAHRLRLVPVSTILATLERAVRDAARERGVTVEFATSGGENRLEGHVLLAVRDALLHVVRNAVAHGIEPAEERVRRSKPSVGRIDLRVERRGHQIVFVCLDDGGGIDVEAVRHAAVERRLISATDAEALQPKDAMQLVFLPGVSTSTKVTELSGRGVGLDVVLETARRFKGDAEVRSELGRQTSLEIRVPVSLSSVSALLVDVGGVTHALPLDATSGALRISTAEIVRAGDKQSILTGERAVPYSSLARLLGVAEANGVVLRACSAVILRSGGRLAAIGVDRLLGTSDLVMKPLPELAGAVPLVMGASLDADGNPQLVLDAAALVAAACSAHGFAAEHAGPQRPPILVIDDSLTTRMLEQSILESAGYEVDLATSAEEALDKAYRRRYGLFVCDVEMPGMDGYGFVTATRADAKLREVPVIMVTSLNAPENRQRGLDAGASEYIVKGEFDQGRLLQRIRALIG